MSADRAVQFGVTCVTQASLAVTLHRDDSSESGDPTESGHGFQPVWLVTLLLIHRHHGSIVVTGVAAERRVGLRAVLGQSATGGNSERKRAVADATPPLVAGVRRCRGVTQRWCCRLHRLGCV